MGKFFAHQNITTSFYDFEAHFSQSSHILTLKPNCSINSEKLDFGWQS
jgi:hypothetical protein